MNAALSTDYLGEEPGREPPLEASAGPGARPGQPPRAPPCSNFSRRGQNTHARYINKSSCQFPAFPLPKPWGRGQNTHTCYMKRSSCQFPAFPLLKPLGKGAKHPRASHQQGPAAWAAAEPPGVAARGRRPAGGAAAEAAAAAAGRGRLRTATRRRGRTGRPPARARGPPAEYSALSGLAPRESKADPAR